MISLLISHTEPASTATAIICIFLLALLILIAAGFLARRIEINYSTD